MTSMTHRRSARAVPAALAASALLALAACSFPEDAAPREASASNPDAGSAGGTVTLVTHDSFHIDEQLLADFTSRTGLEVQQVAPGDGGALVNQLVLTKGNPLGDLAYGIDNSFASRAVAEGVFVPYSSGEPAAADAAAFALPGDDTLTAIDYSDVCLNIDDGWFAEAGVTPPATLEDLTKPEYQDLAVVPAPTTSSPGLAFLMATVAAFGEDGWQDYWRALVDNGVKVVPGWSDAYYTDFTVGGGGDRPIVLSYASSPPFTVPEGGEEPTTSALLETCFRQVEYAGVLAGAKNPEGAKAVLDLLLSAEFQAGIPESMYVYPVASAVELPSDWVRWAPLAEQPLTLDPAVIAEGRDGWVREWSEIVQG
jgi:thiamine transport system substrate-binding protein